MKEQADHFYLSRQEPQRSTLLALRGVILGYDGNVSEAVKYGMPCFLYRKHILCYLWTDRKSGEPYILMARGDSLRHPRLEQGNRVRMKILRIDPAADLPLQTIEAVLAEAVGLYGG